VCVCVFSFSRGSKPLKVSSSRPEDVDEPGSEEEPTDTSSKNLNLRLGGSAGPDFIDKPSLLLDAQQQKREVGDDPTDYSNIVDSAKSGGEPPSQQASVTLATVSHPGSVGLLGELAGDAVIERSSNSERAPWGGTQASSSGGGGWVGSGAATVTRSKSGRELGAPGAPGDSGDAPQSSFDPWAKSSATTNLSELLRSTSPRTDTSSALSTSSCVVGVRSGAFASSRADSTAEDTQQAASAGCPPGAFGRAPGHKGSFPLEGAFSRQAQFSRFGYRDERSLARSPEGSALPPGFGMSAPSGSAPVQVAHASAASAPTSSRYSFGRTSQLSTTPNSPPGLSDIRKRMPQSPRQSAADSGSIVATPPGQQGANWQQSFRALLPNVKINFASPSDAAQQQQQQQQPPPPPPQQQTSVKPPRSPQGGAAAASGWPSAAAPRPFGYGPSGVSRAQPGGLSSLFPPISGGVASHVPSGQSGAVATPTHSPWGDASVSTGAESAASGNLARPAADGRAPIGTAAGSLSSSPFRDLRHGNRPPGLSAMPGVCSSAGTGTAETVAPFTRGGLYNAFRGGAAAGGPSAGAPTAASAASAAAPSSVLSSGMPTQSMGALGGNRGGWPRSPGGGVAMQARASTAEQNQFLSRLVRGDPSLRQQQSISPQRYLGQTGTVPTSPASLPAQSMRAAVGVGADQWSSMFARQAQTFGKQPAAPANGTGTGSAMQDQVIRNLFGGVAPASALTSPPGVLSAPLDAAALEQAAVASTDGKRIAAGTAAGARHDKLDVVAAAAEKDAAEEAHLAKLAALQAAAEVAKLAKAEEASKQARADAKAKKAKAKVVEAQQAKVRADAEAQARQEELASQIPRATAPHVSYEHGVARGVDLSAHPDALLPHLRQYVYTMASAGTPASLPRLDAALDVRTLEMQLAEMHTHTQSLENQMRKMHETCRPFASSR
jgi:hypothetical protein